MSSSFEDIIDGVSTSVAIKAPCRVATTANITLSGEQTIDGVAVVSGDRVLVKDQTTTTENGIYVAATSAWSRAVDFDGFRDVVQGTLVAVANGTANADTFWRVTSANPITIGTTSITFGASNYSLSGVSPFMETVLDDTTAAAARATLGLVIGADVPSTTSASDTAAGIVELATTAETQTGTDATRAVTPDGLNDMASLSGKAWFLDEDDMSSDSATKVPSQQSVKAYVDGASSDITLGTEQASTSGTSIDFTSIPAGTKRITVMFSGVSTNGTSSVLVQVGDSGGVEASGYAAGASYAASDEQSTAGFIAVPGNGASTAWHGSMIIDLEDAAGFSWVAQSAMASPGSAIRHSAGSKSLSAELDRIRITTVNGTDTFDAGAINISYES